MSVIQDKAQEILGRLASPGFEITPGLLAAIGALVTAVMGALQVCFPAASASALRQVQNPSLLRRVRLRRLVRQHLSGNLSLQGRQVEVAASILTTGKNLTQEELVSLYSEAGGGK